MAQRQQEDAVSYNKIIAEHTVKVTPIQRPPSSTLSGDESETGESPEKKQKVKEVFNKNPFYRYFLGSMEYTTTSAETNTN